MANQCVWDHAITVGDITTASYTLIKWAAISGVVCGVAWAAHVWYSLRHMYDWLEDDDDDNTTHREAIIKQHNAMELRDKISDIPLTDWSRVSLDRVWIHISPGHRNYSVEYIVIGEHDDGHIVMMEYKNIILPQPACDYMSEWLHGIFKRIETSPLVKIRSYNITTASTIELNNVEWMSLLIVQFYAGLRIRPIKQVRSTVNAVLEGSEILKDLIKSGKVSSYTRCPAGLDEFVTMFYLALYWRKQQLDESSKKSC